MQMTAKHKLEDTFHPSIHYARAAPSEMTENSPQTPALAIRAESDDNSSCQLYGDASEIRATLHHCWCETGLPASLYARNLMAYLKERFPGVTVC